MKPVIALVGRPNVGKSTLFNRLTKSRDAIVADFPGLTRDRHYGNAKQGKHEFIVIDTGGFEPDATSGIYQEMAKQTRQAVAEADVVLFAKSANLNRAQFRMVPATAFGDVVKEGGNIQNPGLVPA